MTSFVKRVFILLILGNEHMNYRNKIIAGIAESRCRKISGAIVRCFQKMTEGMQSGDDTSLKNLWDEICVQVQGQQSVAWDLYLDTIRLVIQGEVEKLDAQTKQAIWLQTDEGIDWEMNNEDQDAVTFCEDDITEYILQNFVLSAADNWTNKRIEKYLQTESD